MTAAHETEQAPFVTKSTWTDSRVGVEYVVLEPARRSDWLGVLPEVFIPLHDRETWTCSVGGASATADDLRTYAEAILATLDEHPTPSGSGGGQ